MPIDPDLQRELEKRGIAGQASAPPSQSGGPWDEIKKRGLSVEKPAEPQTSAGEAAGAGLWQGLKETAQGVAQLATRMPTILPGAEAGRQRMQADIDRRIQQGQVAYQQNPAVRQHPLMAGAGRLGGNIAATAPLMLMPGGAAARTAAGLLARGAATGVAGAAMQPVTSGGDYWTEKFKQVGLGAVVGAALPAVGSAISPRLPDPSLVAQGVSRAFRPLYNFMTGAEERTIPGFDRTIARQVLDPIGGQIVGRISGHDLVNETEKQISAVYDRVLPHIAFPKAAAEKAAPELDDFVATMSEDHIRRYNELINRTVTGRFGETGIMDGPTFKQVQRDLGARARSWIGTNDDELGRAVIQKLDQLNESMAEANPQFAPDLKKANEAFRMFVPMRIASGGSRRLGEFTPDQFLDALGRGDKTKIAMSRGSAPLQGYAEVGKMALDTKPAGLWDLLHVFGRVGLPAQLWSGVAGPLARRAKDIAPVVAPAAGAVAGKAVDEAEKPRRREPFVSSVGP